MNENKIKGLAVPTEDGDRANKKYVDSEIAKAETDVLKLDGSRAMTGNLQMGGKTITGIRSSSVDDAALTVGGAKATYLPLTGGKAMGGNLNMGIKFNTNVKDPGPANSQYAATIILQLVH